MVDILFEWDEEKNKLNQQRHGVRFEDAKFVFNDPCRVILPDLYHSNTKERWLAIGIVNKMLFVVFTERGENSISLLSVRMATKVEEKLYHDRTKQTEPARYTNKRTA
jgi:uncharacterized DUF497 family protein